MHRVQEELSEKGEPAISEQKLYLFGWYCFPYPKMNESFVEILAYRLCTMEYMSWVVDQSRLQRARCIKNNDLNVDQDSGDGSVIAQHILDLRAPEAAASSSGSTWPRAASSTSSTRSKGSPLPTSGGQCHPTARLAVRWRPDADSRLPKVDALLHFNGSHDPKQCNKK
jgi:hypothetical protein